MKPGDTIKFWTRRKGEKRARLVKAVIVSLSENKTIARISRDDCVIPIQTIETCRFVY